MKHYKLLLFFLFLLIFSIILAAALRSGRGLVNLVIGDKVKILAEIAITPEEKARGLSKRKFLPKDRGLLFIFENETIPSFWMKEMLFPIDIIWIKGGKIIGFEENLEPEASGTEFKIYSPKTTIDMVLEVNAGFVKENNIKIGDMIRVEK